MRRPRDASDAWHSAAPHLQQHEREAASERLPQPPRGVPGRPDDAVREHWGAAHAEEGQGDEADEGEGGLGGAGMQVNLR